MAQSNHDQSIASPTDLPIDGIAGSHPGTQEPAGAHVDAGKTRHGQVAPDGNRQSDPQPAPRRTGSFAHVRPGHSVAPHPVDGLLMGSQGAGSAFQGGSGDSMQGGAESRGQRHDLVQRGSAGSRGN